jgi:hypothetical protein
MLWPTVSRPVCLGIKHPPGAYDQTVAGLLMWGGLSDESTGLSFTTAAGPRQCSHFRVRVPWHSWPYFTVSRFETSLFAASYDSQGYGGGIRPTTADSQVEVEVKVTLRLTVGQSVSLGVEPYVGLMTRYLLLFDSYGRVIVGRPLWREDGSVFFITTLHGPNRKHRFQQCPYCYKSVYRSVA